MQSECRSAFGLLIWLSEAYPQIKYGVNYCCGQIAAPTPQVYSVAKTTLMQILAYPITVT